MCRRNSDSEIPVAATASFIVSIVLPKIGMLLTSRVRENEGRAVVADPHEGDVL
jgi:hypothetical protein